MYSVSFVAKTAIVAVAMLVVVSSLVSSQAMDADGCRVECYPNTKMINGKGGASKGENCRWILRTDGKAARLCDHIKCKKVCPGNQGASSAAQQQDQQTSAASTSMSRIEQQTEEESPNSATNQQPQQQVQGIMRHMHGNKLAKAPVPGVAGGRLSQTPVAAQQPVQPSVGGRRMAPTLPPAVQYDENDTPPPISRFLDISPEE